MEGAINAVRVVAVEYADRKMQAYVFRRIDKDFYPVLIRVTNDSDQRLLVKAPVPILSPKMTSLNPSRSIASFVA